jgi:hypothetical protein
VTLGLKTRHPVATSERAIYRLTEHGDSGIDGIHGASLPTVLRQSFTMRATWMESQPGTLLFE